MLLPSAECRVFILNSPIFFASIRLPTGLAIAAGQLFCVAIRFAELPSLTVTFLITSPDSQAVTV
jgi:hypothetical protein